MSKKKSEAFGIGLEFFDLDEAGREQASYGASGCSATSTCGSTSCRSSC